MSYTWTTARRVLQSSAVVTSGRRAGASSSSSSSSSLLMLPRYWTSRSDVGATTAARNAISLRPYSTRPAAMMAAWGTSASSSSSKSGNKSWQPKEDIDIQHVTQKAIILEVTQQQVRTIEETVPWFLDTMPAAYFRQVPYEFRMDHLKAIAAIRDANMELHLNLQSHLPDGQQVLTFIRPGTQRGRLRTLLNELPWNQNTDSYLPLSRVQVFTATDQSMTLFMFTYGEQNTPKSDADLEAMGAPILDYAAKIQAGDFAETTDARIPPPCDLFEKSALLSYLHRCSESYLGRVEPRRFLSHRLMLERVAGTESIDAEIEESDVDGTTGQYFVDMAVANSLPQVVLEHASRVLFQYKLDIVRVHLDVISDGDGGRVTMLRLLVTPAEGQDQNPQEHFTQLKSDLKRTKWMDPSTMDLVFEQYPWLGVCRGEVVTACAALLHPVMAKQNPYAFSKANILHVLTKPRYIAHSANIAQLFLDRFDPQNPISKETLEERAAQILASVEKDVEDTSAKDIFAKMVDVVRHTLRTNAFMEDRYSLGLRLDPALLMAAPAPAGGAATTTSASEVPYGVIFSHGRRFNAYHVRFRDIARGGMRLVTPPNAESYALESARHFDECYGLAFAQQLKNKDIPEGGSKAVNLINLTGVSPSSRNFIMRKSVKAFTDTLLDLVLETPDVQKQRVDYYGKKEVIYLGPDEQVIPEDINWIVKRAAQRGYDTPSAFMSSKPRSGINHKEFGVTSEGVNVYLDVALREVLKIDPTKEPFTIKMTGGPDGDVAGNEINILIREYGDNVKIVGIADGSGCAEDANGLDHAELLRLVKDSLSISHFDETKLSSQGVLHNAETDTGFVARNTMHNRLEADAFLPAGGRPNTIDSTNFRSFLKQDGTPSSPLIVEGANLFVTGQARQSLFEEAGVVIVKDSSANKGGVITSSYEICAAMLLDEDEFFAHKKEIVEEVLAKLRDLARREAKLMLREFGHYRGSLPSVSQRISKAINVTTDALSLALGDMSSSDLDELLPVFRLHLPKTISDIAFDRVKDRVPEQYIKNAIASRLASNIVYKEGTKFIEAQPADALAKIVLTYLEKEKEVAKLMQSLEASDIGEEDKKRALDLLAAGGARTALDVF